MKKNENIYLIGMMGSWKSTVGKKLALKLNKKFIDTDDEIEDITDMKVSDIFTEFGESRFREMESAYFIEKSKKTGYVFSTGGGIILEPKNRNVLKNNGTTIFLEASIKTLDNRIRNTKKRPLLNNKNNIINNLEKIWMKRELLYKKTSHHTVSTDNLTPDEVLKKILELSIEED